MIDRLEITYLKEDLSRWGEVSLKRTIKLLLSKNGFKLMFVYRLMRIIKNSVLLKPLYYYERIRYHHLCVKYGCDIPSRVEILGGVKILHTVGLTINSQVKIGKNFTAVGVGTLIGGTEKGTPCIGDNVLIGGNATIIGNVRIEDNATIGAGALIVKDVTMGSVAVSMPAVITNNSIR